MNGFEILTALSPIILTLVATYIIVKQYHLDRNRVRLEHFEQRYSIYKSVMNYLFEILANNDISAKKLVEFRMQTSDVSIFFDNEVKKYIDEIYFKANRLRYCWKIIDQRKLDHNKHADLVNEESIILTWLGNQFTVCEKIYINYL